MMAGVFDLELHDAENDKNDESSDDAIEVDEQVGRARARRPRHMASHCGDRMAYGSVRATGLVAAVASALGTRRAHGCALPPYGGAARRARAWGRPCPSCSTSPVQPHSETDSYAPRSLDGGIPTPRRCAGGSPPPSANDTDECAGALFILTRALVVPLPLRRRRQSR